MGIVGTTTPQQTNAAQPVTRNTLNAAFSSLSLANVPDSMPQARYAVSAVGPGNVPILVGAQISQGTPQPPPYTPASQVYSVFGRIGAVTATDTDYDAVQIKYTSGETVESKLPLIVEGSNLTVAGSGQQIGDQRNLLPLGASGVTSVLSTSPIAFTISGTTVNFSVSAFSVLLGSATVAYSAASGSVTQAAGTTVTYYLYFNDPTFAGGTQTLNITTSIQAMASANGIVNIGSATVTVASGGGGGGGTGSGGGGWCVADDMWVAQGVTAGSAQIGDIFDCIDLPSDTGKHKRSLRGVSRGTEECVRMITDNGCALTCSISTPFDLPSGDARFALEMLGNQVVTDLGNATVISLALVGKLPVTRAHLGGVSYAAGSDPARRIYSHNAGTEKP